MSNLRNNSFVPRIYPGVTTFMDRIYSGPRDNSFKKLISNLLEIGEVKNIYIEKLLSSDAIAFFGTAFTHPTASPDNNYEILETLGDLTLNKCIGWYLPRRFPKIFCPEGKDILTRLKIGIIQTKGFAELAESLGFWNFVSCDKDTRNSLVSKQKILEDVFESVFGAIEWYIDSQYRIGTGYSVCYKIISKILDKKEISLKYEDLVDAKTRLKEIFDIYASNLGKIEYKKIESENINEYKTVIYQHTIFNKIIEIGKGNSISKIEAEKMAAEQALIYLQSNGYSKIPDKYKKFI